jgi:integrase/recombinase XerD
LLHSCVFHVSWVVVEYFVAQSCYVYVCVNLRCSYVFVSEHFLYGAQVCSALQQCGGEGVAQRVWRHCLDDASVACHVLYHYQIKRRYIRFLRLERNYSQNTVDAYSHDIDYLLNFLNGEGLAVEEVRLAHLEQFATLLHEFGIAASSQARILCGVRSFFRFLLLDGTLQDDPSELLESPTLGEHLPEVLSTEEIDRMEASIDLSKPEGQRNRAIIEVLFSCGLRVSELVNLKFGDVFADDKYLRITGKGNKQRLVPISDNALHEIQLWL